MAEYVFEQPNHVPDYWDYSDVELAWSCRLIAESRSGPRNAPVRAEAMQLFLLWRETINAHGGSGEHMEDRIGLLCGLRKRTIQLLVRLSLQGLLFIP